MTLKHICISRPLRTSHRSQVRDGEDSRKPAPSAARPLKQRECWSPNRKSRKAEAYNQEKTESPICRQAERKQYADVSRPQRGSRSGSSQAVTTSFDAPNWPWEVNTLTTDELNAYCMPAGVRSTAASVEKLKLTDAELRCRSLATRWRSASRAQPRTHLSRIRTAGCPRWRRCRDGCR